MYCTIHTEYITFILVAPLSQTENSAAMRDYIQIAAISIIYKHRLRRICTYHFRGLQIYVDTEYSGPPLSPPPPHSPLIAALVVN
jgi:hypothetical protein